MGKIRARRQRNSRFNPMSSSQDDNVENVMAVGQDERTSGDVSAAGLQIIGERLASAVVEERLGGLNTLAALALDDHAATVIADSRLIRKVSLLLKDPSVEIRLVAAGALRNVSAGGSQEVVETMVQQDVLSPLGDLLQEYENDWSPVTTDLGEVAGRDVDPMTNTLVHATHFLLNLCECSEEALRFFNQEGLIHILLRHLDPETFGYSLALAATECLLCVSENNPSAQTILLPTADSLVKFISHRPESPVAMHFAAAIAALLVSINYCTSSGSNFQLALQLLAATLEIDAYMHTVQYASQSVATESRQRAMVPQDLEHVILAQHLSLEILSNMCCSEDDEEDWNDSEIVSDNETENGEEECMDFGNRSVLSPEIQEGIAHFKLFQLTLKKVQYPDDNTCEALQNLKHGKSLMEKLRILQIRALLSLQNMISALDPSDVGGSQLMYPTWVELGTMVFRNKCEDNVLEAATGTMRAVMEKLSEDKCDKVSEITTDDIKTILEAGRTCPMASVRANLTRMVGTLGCLLVSQNTEENLYKEEPIRVLSAITEYLIKIASHDNELWVSAEALDVIIDLYSDDKTDKLASRTYLVDSLKEIQPSFKTKYQKQKKRLGDHRPLVMTVKDNLLAFIRYKSPRAAKHRNT